MLQVNVLQSSKGTSLYRILYLMVAAMTVEDKGKPLACRAHCNIVTQSNTLQAQAFGLFMFCATYCESFLDRDCVLVDLACASREKSGPRKCYST